MSLAGARLGEKEEMLQNTRPSARSCEEALLREVTEDYL